MSPAVAALMVAWCLAFTVSGDGNDKVEFNTKSKKYHGLTCRYVKMCTKNCIRIERSDAEKRGGIPCKVCGGRRTAQAGEHGADPGHLDHHRHLEYDPMHVFRQGFVQEPR